MGMGGPRTKRFGGGYRPPRIAPSRIRSRSSECRLAQMGPPCPWGILLNPSPHGFACLQHAKMVLTKSFDNRLPAPL